MKLPPHNPALGQWWTDDGLALALARWWGGLEGATVLEPSAGVGSFVAAALVSGAARVVAVECDPRLVRVLRERFGGDRRVEVILGDFLEVSRQISPGSFDAVLGNPPYDGGADVDHLEAWARVEAPRCFALSKTNVLAGLDAWHRVWSVATLTDFAQCIKRPGFSGTSNGPRQIEFAGIGWRPATDEERSSRAHVAGLERGRPGRNEIPSVIMSGDVRFGFVA